MPVRGINRHHSCRRPGAPVLVVLAVVDDLAQDRRLHVRQGDLLVGAAVVDHVLDQRRHGGDLGRALEPGSLRPRLPPRRKRGTSPSISPDSPGIVC